MINEIKATIKNSEIISFDIFDTLLLRPYYKPEDLFLHLELIEKAKNFKQARIEAEEIARERLKHKEEISLDDIYMHIPQKYKHLKEKEIELEYQILQVNTEVLDIFNYAKSLNKKIIITSDMYLPYEFVNKILNKNGIKEYYKLYLSSKENKTKNSSSLYKEILKDLDISPSKIFHIGDNKYSDYDVPRQLGINSFLYPKAINRFINSNKIFFYLSKTKKMSLGISITLGICAINWIKHKKEKNYFYNLGFNVAGIADYCFCNFINKEAIKNNINQIFFVTRDGYTLEKSFKNFNNNIPTNYVTLNRFQKKIEEFINGINLDKDEYQQIILFLQQAFPNNELVKTYNSNTTNIRDFISNNYDTLKILLSQYKKIFYDYIKNITNSDIKNIMVADSITKSFSAALLAKQILQDKNIYSITLQTAAESVPEGINSLYLLKPQNKYAGFQNWNLMEFFFSAPTTQVLGINFMGKFIYDKENYYEKSNITAYNDVSVGMINFVKETKNIFLNRDVFINIDDVILVVNSFCTYYTNSDYANMKRIFHSSDNNQIYENILSKKSLLKRKFNKLKRDLKKAIFSKLT